MRRLTGKKFRKFRPDIIHEISCFKKSPRGPTECEKATLPGMIAGLAKANDGHIYNHGRYVNSHPGDIIPILVFSVFAVDQAEEIVISVP
jgi:ABC-type iron transport system FetAB ATPase subunit